jgi:hypothetical protein
LNDLFIYIIKLILNKYSVKNKIKIENYTSNDIKPENNKICITSDDC